MNKIQVFNVSPVIPPELRFVQELSRNLWWSWNLDAIELFRRINRELWRATGHNPVVFLSRLSQTELEALAKDSSFLAHMERVQKAYQAAVFQPADVRNAAYQPGGCIAYFSAEYGLHESIALVAGGLGVLAGDHLKAASNMGLPLVAVGLLYAYGYFRQYLNNDGWQQETYPDNELQNLPISPATGPDNKRLVVEIRLPEQTIFAAVWRMQVGRIPVYLLDANIPQNPPETRKITAQLYGGDLKNRLLQEILLGIGGMRALHMQGIQPAVCHMNEGHSAFISLERLAYLMNEKKLSRQAALEIVPRTNVFTMHTAVAAGHDEFPVEMVAPFFRGVAERLQCAAEEVLSWGQPPKAPPTHPFSMTVFALRMSQFCNGVSELHGRVARRLCAHLWPQRPEEEIPITHITNGAHTPSWLSPENALLFDRYLGPNWMTHPSDPAMGARIDNIPAEELWRAHELSRARLVRECRQICAAQLERRNSGKAELETAASVLDPEAMTIGFARRFATYKRANLLFMDPARIEAVLRSEEMPVQIVFSGKAHPHDNGGKELIKQIVHFARRPGLARKIIFLEDYNIDVARTLVQGVDVWLNTPRRPMEASGTSGMKAAANGALNVSILDGWWCEGYSPARGWSIGRGEEYQDHAYQDYIESRALYNLLETDIIPCFYRRSQGQIPGEWVKMMKESIKMAFMQYSSHRMAREYEEKFYIPAIERSLELLAADAAEAKALAARRARLEKHWRHTRLKSPVTSADLSALQVGDFFKVSVEAHLGELAPGEVNVELYCGPIGASESISRGAHQQMGMAEERGNGDYLYECRVDCHTTGRFGFTACMTPMGDDWFRFLPMFITWA